MNYAQICNIVAWVLSGVLAFMIFSDFIRTEIQISKENKKKEKEGAKK